MRVFLCVWVVSCVCMCVLRVVRGWCGCVVGLGVGKDMLSGSRSTPVGCGVCWLRIVCVGCGVRVWLAGLCALLCVGCVGWCGGLFVICIVVVSIFVFLFCGFV